ncbi:hypothetical protein ABPG75_010759 [Micractinium tetrahymenae]
MRSWLLAVALAGCIACSAARPVVSSDTDSGIDAAFLQSWMGLDAELAAKVATDGAAAVAARRELMNSARNLGEQMLPGAYPAPGPTVTFTAQIATTAAKFNLAAQNLYRSLVLIEAKKAGANGLNPADVDLQSITTGPAALAVRTRVALKAGQEAAAQALVNRLAANPDAAWLDSTWPGSSVSDTAGSTGCSDPLCRACPASPGVCTDCVPSIGTKGRFGYASIYKTADGKCRKCLEPHCTKCSPTGRCAADGCEAGYKADAQGRCKKACADPLCSSCAADGRKCYTCVTNAGTFPVYLSPKNGGQCRLCTRPNCGACSNDGRCSACNAGYTSDGRGGCRRACSSPQCTSCPASPTKCLSCVNGYQVVSGACHPIPQCSVQFCDKCFPGNDKFCKTCQEGYSPSANFATCVEDCNVSNCAACSPNTRGQVCARCIAPYVLSAGRCKRR